MTDFEKVIKGLECCQDCDGYVCRNCCPYHDKNEPEDQSTCTCHLAHDALALLKAQEPMVIELKELAFYDSGLYVETRNGCPEGLTEELWPALVHLYCVSQNGECGYISFVNWNADTYDFEAKDYNVNFRCWTSRPTKEEMEAILWNAQK